MEIRLLERDDYYKGYLDLLSELTPAKTFGISFSKFCKQYNKLKSVIYVIVIDNVIVGSGTLFIEYKFIRDLSCVGHIEDIVISEKYRKAGLGKIMINFLINKAKSFNVYKVILNCSNEVLPFYEKCGFTKMTNGMAMYFAN